MNDIRKAGRPRKVPAPLEGPCTSCQKRPGSERAINGSAVKSILCDGCAELRARRIEKNRKLDSLKPVREEYARVEAPAAADAGSE